MPDLHARLLAAVNQRRQLALAATPGGWLVHEQRHANVAWSLFWVRSVSHGAVTHDIDERGVGVERASDEGGRADAEHIAANGPAQILRDTAAHLAILARHAPCGDTHSDTVIEDMWGEPYWRHAPELACHQHAEPTRWPCPDIQDLASVYPGRETPSERPVAS